MKNDVQFSVKFFIFWGIDFFTILHTKKLKVLFKVQKMFSIKISEFFVCKILTPHCDIFPTNDF